MNLTFYGATKTVTGSKYLLKLDTKNILIDCGLFQGYKELRLRNWDKLPFDPRHIDAVILTHAHIDHSGYLPLLVKNGFKGRIYSTPGTKDLCSILLPDSGHIQEEDAYFANKHGFSKHKKALPLYTEEEAVNTLKQFTTVDFEKTESLFEGCSFSFLPAGHIIGASFVKITKGNTTIVFTGDIGRPNDPIMCDPAIIENTDYLIMESTYGDRLHSKEPPTEHLSRIIKETAKRGGKLIIPAFAVGRAQNLLYYIDVLKKGHKIPNLPVFLDSPMATDVTDLLCRHVGEHRLSKRECHDLCKSVTYVRTPDESRMIDSYSMPIIIISASGMATGGRVLHHLKALASDSRNTILFSGFQAGGTRGDRILRGEQQIKIHGQMIPIRAQVEFLDNTSAHADYEEVLQWLTHFKKPPKKTFIIHGEEQAALSLKSKIEDQFHWNCIVPEYLQSVDL